MTGKNELYDTTVNKWRAVTQSDYGGGGGGGGGLTSAETSEAFSQSLEVNGTESTVTPTQVALSASTSAALKTATVGRIRFVIYNPLATVLYVRKAASAASATAFDFTVPANGGQYFSDAYEYAGELRGFCTTAGSVNFSESV